MKCKDCKWWDKEAPNYDWKEWNKDTKQYDVEVTHRKCHSPKCGDERPDGFVDAEDYGGVYTGPEFGCIHWEKKT